jgi:predicted kinase
MPRAPRPVTYHGQTMTIAVFCELNGVWRRTVAKWSREGTFTDADLDAYFEKREARRAASKLAQKHGVSANTLSMRLMRGKSLHDAATLPVRVYERRTG